MVNADGYATLMRDACSESDQLYPKSSYKECYAVRGRWALGVALYHMVCGRLPFDTIDSLPRRLLYDQVREASSTITHLIC